MCASMHGGDVNTTLNPRIRRTPAHVIFSRVAQDLSHRVRIHSVSQTAILHIYHSMSHVLLLLYPSHLSSTSFSTCTPVRPSTRPSATPLLMSSSHGDLPCADPSNVSFGPLQVVSPRISLKRATLCWSNRCSSTDRA